MALSSSKLGFAKLGSFRLGTIVSSSSPDYTLSVDDGFSLSDEVLATGPLSTSVSDTLAMLDELLWDFLIYTEPLSAVFADAMEPRDSEWVFQLDPANFIEFGDALWHVDEVVAAETFTQNLSETITFSDAFTSELIFATEAGDTFQYNWLDGVIMALDQGVEVFDDGSANWLEGVTVASVIYVLNTAQSESLSNWSDALIYVISSPAEFEDAFAQYDELVALLAHLYELSETIVFTDFADTATNSFGTLADSFSLSDGISTSLGTQVVVALSQSVSDTFTLSEAAYTQTPYTMLDYLRGYLNDRG